MSRDGIIRRCACDAEIPPTRVFCDRCWINLTRQNEDRARPGGQIRALNTTGEDLMAQITQYGAYMFEHAYHYTISKIYPEAHLKSDENEAGATQTLNSITGLIAEMNGETDENRLEKNAMTARLAKLEKQIKRAMRRDRDK